MGKVYIDTVEIGTFEPQVSGTTGKVWIDTAEIGTFTLGISGNVFLDSVDIGDYTIPGTIYGRQFETLMDTFRRGFGGNPSFDVTLSTLSFGDRDSVTGWYAKNYTKSTIKMVIIQKESQNMALQLGYWVSLDALGLTIIPVEVYDLITDSFERTWEVKSVKPIMVGNTIRHFVCDLKELPLYA